MKERVGKREREKKGWGGGRNRGRGEDKVRGSRCKRKQRAVTMATEYHRLVSLSVIGEPGEGRAHHRDSITILQASPSMPHFAGVDPRSDKGSPPQPEISRAINHARRSMALHYSKPAPCKPSELKHARPP